MRWGYGRPPAEYRFKKGGCGNPEGRRTATKTAPTISSKAMSQSVTITENGKRRKISKLDAAVTQLANDAARGDKKAIPLAFALLQALQPAIEAQRPVYFLGGVLTRRPYDLNGGDSP